MQKLSYLQIKKRSYNTESQPEFDINIFKLLFFSAGLAVTSSNQYLFMVTRSEPQTHGHTFQKY